MFFGIFPKKAESNNVELLTEGFTTTHNSICKIVDSSCAKAGTVFSDSVRVKIEKASKFEIGMYLLFRLDQRMSGKQEVETARRALFDSCMRSILPSDNDHFINLVYHRLEIYGEIFNDNKGSGGDWGKFLQECHFWLVNAMMFSKNNYEKMVAEKYMPVDLRMIELFPVNIALQECEVGAIGMFLNVLKQVFSDNTNFMLLPKKELIRRINVGLKEAASIQKK